MGHHYVPCCWSTIPARAKHAQSLKTTPQTTPLNTCSHLLPRAHADCSLLLHCIVNFFVTVPMGYVEVSSCHVISITITRLGLSLPHGCNKRLIPLLHTLVIFTPILPLRPVLHGTVSLLMPTKLRKKLLQQPLKLRLPQQTNSPMKTVRASGCCSLTSLQCASIGESTGAR